MATGKLNRKHEEGILDVIKNNPVYNFKDIFVYYTGCSRATGYNHALDTLDSIKEAIHQNKRKEVTTLISKWLKSDNATLQIAAMRLLCESEEHRRLNQQYQDLTTNNEKIKFNLINGG